jgi:moderate conductance mechanosensitive channel
MHLLSQGPTQLAGPAALPLVAGGLLPDPGSMVASMGELLVTRSLKVAAVMLGAVVLNRLVRWLLRRLVGGLEHRYIQQPLESLRAKTPRALLASTDPLPSLRRSQRAEMIGAALANVASVAIWLAAAILVLHVLGLRLGPLLAGAGLAGLVLSLSAQQMVRDFLSGIAMLMEDQYGPGDVVDAGPAKGVVERVGLRTTRLRAVDGIVWHVRNGEIERLGNESRDWARVLVDVEVARGTDLAQARRTVEQAAQKGLFPCFRGS